MFAGDAKLENLILKESALVSVFYSFNCILLVVVSHLHMSGKLKVILKQQRWLKS